MSATAPPTEQNLASQAGGGAGSQTGSGAAGSTASASSHKSHTVAEEPVTSILRSNSIPLNTTGVEWNADEEMLAALGYKPEFKREFNLWSTFAVSFAVLGLLPSFASTLLYGMGYAGTAGMTWGWLVSMSGIISVAVSMGELCSAMPTSGGLYYASAVLAPPGWGPLAAWVTGWSNWLTQITAPASVNYGSAGMMLACANIVNPDFVPQQYQIFLVSVGLMVIHSVMSSLPTHWLAKVNNAGSVFNVLALLAVIIIIPVTTNRKDNGYTKFTPSSEVWGTVYPGTEFAKGVCVLMSFQAGIWAMAGYDSAYHLSEECASANTACPTAIVLTASLGGLFGWFLELVVAYTVVDIGEAINSSTGQPFAGYLVQAVPQKVALAVLSLTIVAGFFMGQGCMIGASRVTFAYARDGCFPLSQYWSRVNETTQTPVNAVWFNCALGCALLLLILGGDVVIGAAFSVGACSSFVAFTIPVAIRVFAGERFRPGPWNLGKFSIPIGVYGCAFVALMVPIMCLPATVGKDLNAKGMNWTCVVYGGPMIAVLTWWYFSARNWFVGPNVNVESVHVDDADGESLMIDDHADTVVDSHANGNEPLLSGN